jgi:hypothetical protein
MTKTKKKIKGCTGKVPYKDKEVAYASLRHMIKRHDKKGLTRVAKFQVYGCKCGAFHIGKTGEIVWKKVR